MYHLNFEQSNKTEKELVEDCINLIDGFIEDIETEDKSILDIIKQSIIINLKGVS